ncbi:MAG: DUF748 domain-containing protein [Nitrospira sp.]
MDPPQTTPSWPVWTVISVAILMVALLGGAYFTKEPLRRYVEKYVNQAVDGYSFHIGRLDLHPLTLSVVLRNVIVRQEAHPDPPLASVPEIVLDVQFTTLLAGEMAVDIYLNDPVLSVTQQHFSSATMDDGAVQQKRVSWQDRISDLAPVEAALFIRNGEVRYAGQPAGGPIRMTELNITARNLTNRPTDDQSYPVEVHITTRLFADARMEIDGRANLLAKPFPSVDATVKLNGLRIADLMSLAGSHNLMIGDGVFMAEGRVKYGEQMVIALESFVLEGAKIGYLYREETKLTQRRQLQRGAEEAAKAHRDPSFVFKVGHGKILDSEVGFVNRSTNPEYRVFLSELNGDLDNFSNRLEEGTGVVKITGKFMASGPMVVIGRFRPEKPRPDFDLAVRIIKTDVATLNDLLRAYGNVDTHHGKFALFSELTVKNNRIDGYVKPLLQDVEVYDPKKDRNKALSEKMYRAVVDGVMSLLENVSHDEVATKGDVSGPVENPQANTWQIIEKLVQNAFFKAILPGFEGHT